MAPLVLNIQKWLLIRFAMKLFIYRTNAVTQQQQLEQLITDNSLDIDT